MTPAEQERFNELIIAFAHQTDLHRPWGTPLSCAGVLGSTWLIRASATDRSLRSASSHHEQQQALLLLDCAMRAPVYDMSSPEWQLHMIRIDQAAMELGVLWAHASITNSAPRHKELAVGVVLHTSGIYHYRDLALQTVQNALNDPMNIERVRKIVALWRRFDVQQDGNTVRAFYALAKLGRYQKAMDLIRHL